MTSLPARAILALLIGSLAVAAPDARADRDTGTADEAQTAFELGNREFAAAHYRDALAFYFVSNRLAPNRNVAFNIARCFENLGELVEAYRYYQDHNLAATEAKEASAAQSRDALARLAPRVSLAEVTSDPPGATIYVNRKNLGAYGRTPQTIALAPGKTTVIVEADGYVTFTSPTFDATPGKVESIVANLPPITGTLVVSGGPAGATVEWLKGGVVAARGVLPGSIAAPAGAGRLRVSQPGFEAREQDVVLEPREERAFQIDLEPETGTLLVSGDEAGALIRIDGVPVGFTPAVLDRVAVGRHALGVSAEGFAPFRTTVEVARGTRTEVFAQLAASTEVEAASRTALTAAEAPASVSLISSYEIRMFDLGTLDDALTGVRGTIVTNDYTYPIAGFRGFAPLGDFGNRVQIQLDGHIINLAYDGSQHAGLDGLVGLQGLERIEVVRGPGSTLYGTGALFGVYNLVFPRDIQDRAGRVGVSLLGANTARAWMDYRLRFGDDGTFFTYNGLAYTQPHPYKSPAAVGSEDFPDGVAPEAGEHLTGTLSGVVRLGKLSVHWFYNSRDLSSPTAPFGIVYGNPDNNIIDRQAFIEARYEPKLSDAVALDLRLSLDHAYYLGRYPRDLVNDDVYVERFFGYGLRSDNRLLWRANDKLNVTFGLYGDFGFDNRMVGGTVGSDDTTLDVAHPIIQFAGYALAEWAVLENLTLHGGVRVDGRTIIDEKDGLPDATAPYVGTTGAVSPRLAGVIRLSPDTTLKVMAGSAFRAPSFYELTYGDGGETQLPPADLNPETIYTAETEVNHRLGDSLVFSGGLYVSSLADNVTLVGEGTSEDPIIYTNRTNPVSALGLELEIQQELRRGALWGLSVSIQRSVLGGLFDGEVIENSPTVFVNAKAIVPLVQRVLHLVSRINIDSGRKDLEGKFTDPGIIWDVGIAGHLDAIRGDYSLTVRNALDWKYDHPGSGLVPDIRIAQPGIALHGDFSLRF